MAEEIDFENGRNSNFGGLMTLTFDPAIRHIVLQQSSTSTNKPNVIQIEETFCGRTDVRTDGRTDGQTDIFPLYIIRSTFVSRPNNVQSQLQWSDIVSEQLFLQWHTIGIMLSMTCYLQLSFFYQFLRFNQLICYYLAN